MLNVTRTARRLVCVVVALALSGGAAARGQTLLRWKFEPGQKLHYVVHIKMNQKIGMGATPTTMTTTQIMNTSREVKSVEADGTAVVIQTIDRMRMKQESPQGVMANYDSASEEEPEGMAKMMAPMFEAMVGKSISVKMNARGEVSDVKLPPGMLDEMKKMPFMEMMDDMFSEENMKQMMGNIALPEEPVAEGHKWSTETSMQIPMLGKGKVKMAYEYVGSETRNGTEVEKILTTMEMDITGTEGQLFPIELEGQEMTGAIYFDAAAGYFTESEMKTTMKMKVGIGEKKMEIDSEMDQRMELVQGEASQ